MGFCVLCELKFTAHSRQCIAKGITAHKSGCGESKGTLSGAMGLCGEYEPRIIIFYYADSRWAILRYSFTALNTQWKKISL